MNYVYHKEEFLLLFYIIICLGRKPSLFIDTKPYVYNVYADVGVSRNRMLNNFKQCYGLLIYH